MTEPICLAGMGGSFLAGLVGGVVAILVIELLFAVSQVDRAVPQDEPWGEA